MYICRKDDFFLFFVIFKLIRMLYWLEGFLICIRIRRCIYWRFYMVILVIVMIGVFERWCCSKVVYSVFYNLLIFGCVCVLKWKICVSIGMGMNLVVMGGILELGLWMWSLWFIFWFICLVLWKSIFGVLLFVWRFWKIGFFCYGYIFSKFVVFFECRIVLLVIYFLCKVLKWGKINFIWWVIWI